MRHWLITTPADADLDNLRSAVEARGGRLSAEPPVPLDRGEQVVGAEGPEDLPDGLAQHPSVRAVHPDSELGLY
jgi:hypothetical protein